MTCEAPSDELLLRLEGSFDRDSVPQVRKNLLRLAKQVGLKKIAMDFARIDKMDTAGVAVMVELLEAALRKGCLLCVEGLSEEARRLFRLARLEQTFCLDDQSEPGV